MASILDIAKKAGVSHGTVSNVLNKKGNVSAEKIKLVEAAALELNYFSNSQAKILRKGQSSAIALIIGSFKVEEYLNLYNGLNKTLFEHDLEVDLYEKPKTKSQLIDLIVSFGLSKYTHILTLGFDWDLDGTSADEMHSIMFNLDVLVNLKQDNTESLVLYHPSIKGSILSNDMSYESLVQILDAPSISFVYYDTYRVFKTMCDTYGLDINAKTELYSETPYNDVDIMHVTKFYDLGRKIAHCILDKVSFDTVSLSVFTYPRFKHKQYQETQEIKIISNTNPSISALEQIAPVFERFNNIRLNIEIVEHTELYDIINSDKIKDYDFVRIDISIFPYFAHNKFETLPDIEIYEGKNDIYNQVIEKVVGRSILSKGVPFDTSIQSMFYRSDILEDELFKRMYFEQEKKAFKIPNNIHDYLTMAAFIKEHPEFGLKAGNAMNLNDPNVISSDFLLIYYGLNGRLVDDQGLQLDPKIGITALEAYMRLAQVSYLNYENWFTQAIKDYGEGKIASIFGYSNQILNVSKYEIIESTAVAEVPGSTPMLGGGILAMVNQKEINNHFLKWFLNPYTKYLLAQHNGVPTNGHLMNQEEIIDKFDHLNASLKNIDVAVRETYDIHGEPINIYQYEYIIGKTIKKHWGCNSKELLNHINQALLKEWSD